MHILAIAGSLRTGSSNAAFVRAISRLAPQNTTEASFAVPFVRKKLNDCKINDPNMVKQLLAMFDALREQVGA